MSSAEAAQRGQVWLAFVCSAISGHLPNKAKYKAGELENEIIESSLSIADEMLKEYVAREKLDFEPDDDDDDDDDEEEEDEEDRSSRRARR